VPKFIFDLMAVTNSRLRYQIEKLLGDECYSSEKLQSIGFTPQRTLQHMNETQF